jgi:hypothetical protein
MATGLGMLANMVRDMLSRSAGLYTGYNFFEFAASFVAGELKDLIGGSEPRSDLDRELPKGA